MSELEDHNLNVDVIYFVAYKHGDTTKITVVDLANTTIYERDQFSPVNDENYYELQEALSVAKALAAKYQLQYVPFESRISKSLNENVSPPKLTL